MEVKNLTLEFNDSKSDLNLLRKDVDKLKDFVAKLKVPTLDQFNELKGKHDQLEGVVASLKKMLGELAERMKNMKTGGAETGGADQEQLEKCLEDLQNLKKAFEKHRD